MFPLERPWSGVSTSREIRTHTVRVLSALSLPIGLGRYMVRRDGLEPPMFTTWVSDLQSDALAAMRPTHEVTQRVTRYFEVSIFTLLANLDGASVRKAICLTLPAARKSAIGITNICWSLSKQNR